MGSWHPEEDQPRKRPSCAGANPDAAPSHAAEDRNWHGFLQYAAILRQARAIGDAKAKQLDG
jgi:hypothetical protein